MIKNVCLWHVTPVHIGTEFLDPTTSLLEADEEIYLPVNSNEPIPKGKYNPADYRSVKRMQNFLS